MERNNLTDLIKLSIWNKGKAYAKVLLDFAVDKCKENNIASIRIDTQENIKEIKTAFTRLNPKILSFNIKKTSAI